MKLRASMHFYAYLLLISMLWHRQAIFESKGDKLSSSAECRIRTQRVSETQSSADWMPADKPIEAIEDQAKNLNSTARHARCKPLMCLNWMVPGCNCNNKHNFKYDFMCNIKNISTAGMILTKSDYLLNWVQIFYFYVKQLKTMHIHSVRSL